MSIHWFDSIVSSAGGTLLSNRAMEMVARQIVEHEGRPGKFSAKLVMTHDFDHPDAPEPEPIKWPDELVTKSQLFELLEMAGDVHLQAHEQLRKDTADMGTKILAGMREMSDQVAIFYAMAFLLLVNELVKTLL